MTEVSTSAPPVPAESAAATWLDGAPAVLALPTYRPRPAVLAAEVSAVDMTLSGGTTGALDAFAERTGHGVGTVLLTALRVLLSRTTDELDLVVGFGAEGGTLDGTALVVRAPVDLEEGFAAALESTASGVAAAAQRGPRSVPDLVRELGLEPGSGKHPVFQVGLVAVPGRPTAAWPGSWGTPADLVVAWWRASQHVQVTLQWATGLFLDEQVTRTGRHLVQLLEQGLRDDSRPVGELPLLTDDEVAEIDGWNTTTAPHDPSVTLATRFWTQVERTPEAAAVEERGIPVSYRELGDRAAALAHRLRDAGVRSDVPVAVCAERSVDMVVGVLATLMAGGVYVPVDPAYPAGRRDFMVSESGARVLLTQRGLSGLVPAGTAVQVVLLDEPQATRDGDDPRPHGGSGQDLGYVVYTSGSTGQPKGVAMPQSALGNLVDWQLRRPQFVTGARTLQFSSLSFDVSFQELFTTWASGGTLVLVDEATRRDPLRLLHHLVEHRVERLFLPYVALRGLAAAVAATGRFPTTLREVYTAGEQLQVDPVLRALFDGLPGTRLENQYGPSESHVVTAHTLAEDTASWPALPPIGGPIANSSVHVLDARLQRRPVGVPGELYLAGTCLARGYLGREDLTRERFVPAPWGEQLYRTGDLVRWLPSGELEFLGRLDHQVKFRGYRIEPGEVGAVLSAFPDLEQCVALVRTVDAGPRLTAYLVPRAGTEVDLGAVHRFAKDHLPGYMVPSHYLVVPVLPLTSSGKIDTAALPDAAFDRGILASPYQAPSSREEQVLADIWSTLLGVPEVGVLDDFFELGGDSLLAAEMVQQVSERLGREMPLGALAQAPTIAGLAGLLTADDSTLWRSLVPLQPGDERVTPLFVVHGGSGNVATFPRLARALSAEQPVYALQWDGFGGGRGQPTVEKMARHYVSEMRAVQTHGPYLLAGQCIGGLVAHEMTRLLQQQGERVDLLVLYDSPHLGSPAYVPAPRPTVRQVATNPRRAKSVALDVARAVYRRTPTKDPVKRGARVMRRAAWQHRPAPLLAPVPTHYIGSGESKGSAIALDGHWTDGAMGWSHLESEHFTVHRLTGDHNSVMYDDEALDVLRTGLRRAHDSHAATRP